MSTAFLCLLAVAQSKAQVDDSRVPTGATLKPYGRSVVFAGRPVDLAISGERVFVKDNLGLRILSRRDGSQIFQTNSPGGTSLLGLVAKGDKVYLTNAANGLHEFDGATGKLVRTVLLPGPEGKGNAFPCGIALDRPGNTAYVCLSRNNSLGVVDLQTGKLVREIPTGIAPISVALSADGKTAYVSNQGGRRPSRNDRTATSAGTDTKVDDRGIASSGTVSIIDLATSREVRQVDVGLQPTEIVVLSDGKVAVANANDDSVSFIQPGTGIETRLTIKPDERLPFGSMPNGLTVSPDGRRLWVSCAGNNAVAAVDLKTRRVEGWIPTGWYPTAVAQSGADLLIANLKGTGSRISPRKKEEGRNSHDHSGSLQLLTIPPSLTASTQTVRSLVQAPQILRALERRSGGNVAPVAVPAKLGDPSLIEHVVYVIKENRTYDQVFGDMPVGDGDPSLCIYPDEVTPNHHALAREFVLLDNYYCNGVLSADGHSWATEGNVTPYLERAFGGFNRSYTFGDDPLTYSSTGFVWDRVLEAGLSFRNYGEMNYSEPPKGMKIADILKARAKGEPVEFSHNIGITRLRRYSNLRSPGWNMEIPDVVRVDRFLEEFRQFEKNGGFPNFTLIYLPQDHVGSSVTNRANVADNDLALGNLVEAISKSKYWGKTAIFVNEDDPQNGFDHVDGHRSICLVVSPYSRKGTVESAFYNQTSVLHTMLRILGCPPLNQQDAGSPLMTACFTNKADLRPYTARPNRVPLDETKVPIDADGKLAAYAAQVKARLPLARTGMKTDADEEALNRLIWHEAKGLDAPYPAHLAGPHGKGLAKKGAKHSGN